MVVVVDVPCVMGTFAKEIVEMGIKHSSATMRPGSKRTFSPPNRGSLSLSDLAFCNQQDLHFCEEQATQLDPVFLQEVLR